MRKKMMFWVCSLSLMFILGSCGSDESFDGEAGGYRTGVVSVSPYELVYTPAGGEKTFVVDYDKDWRVFNLNNIWFDLSSSTGVGKTTITVKVKPSLVKEDRSVSMKVQGGVSTTAIGIRQSGRGGDLFLSSNYAGERTLTVSNMDANKLKTVVLGYEDSIVGMKIQKSQFSINDLSSLKTLSKLKTLNLQNTKVVASEGSTMKDDVLPSGAFQALTGVAKIALSDTITTINDDTFKNCTSLTDAYLPLMVEEIGTGTFDGCTSLENIYIGAYGVPEIADPTSFDGKNIYVRTGLKSLYLSAYAWLTADKIFEFDAIKW